MERAAVASPAAARPPFRDGLGERRHIADPSGNVSIEQLCLRAELAAVPSFEFALRERVSRGAAFRHDQFARARTVERLSEGESTLAVVSERIPGVRLSELLQAAEQRRLGLDITAALHLIRQLVPAVAAFHESARQIAHGAIGPERLVVTPDGRLVVVEYVLGAALEQLRYPRERYWAELRVALPSSAGLPRFDQRADVTQIGIVALSLILGRPMRDDEFPARLADVVASTWAVSPKGGFEPLPAGLRGWLGRALQLDARSGFNTALEAKSELEKVLADGGDYMASPESFDAFLARYHGNVPKVPAARPTLTPVPHPSEAAATVDLEATPPLGLPTPSDLSSAAKPRPVSAALPAAERALSTQPPEPVRRPSLAIPPPSVTTTPPRGIPAPVAATPAPGTPRTVTPATKSVVTPSASIASAPTPARGLSSSSIATTLPPRADVPIPSVPLEFQSFADAVMPAAVAPTPPRGLPVPSGLSTATPPPMRRPPTIVKPVSPDPAPTPSVALREADDEPRNWPKLAAMAGVLVAPLVVGAFAGWLYFKPRPVVAPEGTLVVTTSPTRAQVFVDGVSRGLTPQTLPLAAGLHRLELKTPAGSRTIPITITAGAQSAQYVELPRERPGAGQLQIRTTPPGARVTVDGVARGVSPVTVGELAAGEHAVLLESDLGSVKQAVTIESGSTAQLVVPLTAPDGAPVSGWITVTAPIELQIYEGDRLLGTSRSDRTMLATGRHDIDLVNDAFGYRATRSVQVSPGKVSALTAEMPSGTIALNATPWAEVWIDGARIGETPIGNHQLPIGQHQVVFRHPELGDETYTATVTLKETARLSVDLRKQ